MGQLETSVVLGIYRTADGSRVMNVTADLKGSRIISLTNPSPCIVHPSPVCYWIREFYTTVELPKNPEGYMVIFQRCCRIDGIRNLVPDLNVGHLFLPDHGTNAVDQRDKQ
jgi:hypothetical protein